MHLELTTRAKGILLMREAGFKIAPDPEIKARLDELKYLEKSIGKTGQFAMASFLRASSRDLWQLYMLGKKWSIYLWHSANSCMEKTIRRLNFSF